MSQLAHRPQTLKITLPSPTIPVRSWRLLSEARTRILLWYLLLLGFFIMVSLPLMRQFVFAQVDARVREDMQEDMDLFQQLLANDEAAREKLGLLRDAPSKKLTIPPTNAQEFQALVEVYLSRRLPEDDSFMIAFVRGQLLDSSPKALPRSLDAESKLGRQWAMTTQPQQGERLSPHHNIGNILYLVQPIYANGTHLGTFVVAHTTAGEREEALEALSVIFQVMMLVLVAALVLAWFAAGKVLAPLRVLARTAHAITEADLTQRIPVWGKGELADLAITFNEMMDRLETAFATQRNFINDAGHELRTPITIIRGHLELMGNDPQEQAETTALVLDELDRMSRFVEDMILLAKSERPDFLQLETIDLQVFSQELLAKASTLGDRDWQLESIAKGRMVGDRQRLTQAIMNLAQNAVQHTTPIDKITFGTAIRKQRVYFWIKDTGEGIAPSDQQRIFERFARATHSRRRSEGAGLGLAIVQAIVEAHGGHIHLRSQPGTGAAFSLMLPLEPAQEWTLYDSHFDC